MMKKCVLIALLLCVLLAGCGGKEAETQPMETTAQTTAPVETTESLMIEFTEETEAEETVAATEATEETVPAGTTKPQQGSTTSGSVQPSATQPPAQESQPPVQETQPPVQETQPSTETEGTPDSGGIELPDDNWG